MFFDIAVLKNFANVTGKQLLVNTGKHRKTPVGVFFSKIAGLQAYNFIKKKIRHWCFPVKLTEFL